MTAPSSADNGSSDALLTALVQIGVYANNQAALEHALVVLAMGRSCWIVDGDRGQQLLVEGTDIEPVVEQLRRFDRESLNWPPPPLAPSEPERSLDLVSPLVWALVVLGAFWGEALYPRLVEIAALDRAAVFERHEWWRILTSLFMHADIAHLLSNAVSGVFVFGALAGLLGRKRAWLAVFVSAALGNLASVALNFSTEYRSIGASTAVFAGVGLLTGQAIRTLIANMGRRWRAIFTPLASGCLVLALYGAGGIQVDVGAHLTGFVAGLGVGLLALNRGEHAAVTGK